MQSFFLDVTFLEFFSGKNLSIPQKFACSYTYGYSQKVASGIRASLNGSEFIGQYERWNTVLFK